MRAYWTLVRRELEGHFFSWIGYTVNAAALVLMGVSFSLLFHNLNGKGTEIPITQIFCQSWFFWIILLVTAPVITMRSFALEKFSGTFETLMTAPVSDLQVVLAKFTGALLAYLVMWLPLLACLLLARRFSNDATILDAGSATGTFVGILLLGFLYISMGCFASAVTRHQIIAAMFGLALGISLFLPSFVSTESASQSRWLRELIRYVDLGDHMHEFTRGVVDSRPVVLYLSLGAFFLFLTWKVVESRRWK